MVPGIDIVISAKDKASQVMQRVGQAGGRAAKLLENNWLKVSTTAVAAGGAIEYVARSQAPLTEQTQRLSASLGMGERKMRELAISTSDVTFPLSEVLDLMEIGRQQGLEGADALEQYASFWDMVGDATGENAVVLGEAGVALRAVGIAAGEEGQALEAFGYVTEHTTGDIAQFLYFIERTGPELREMGADVNDAAAIMGILEHEFGMTARTARQEFRSAVNEADGDMGKMLDTLDISAEKFGEYSKKVSQSGDIIQRNADIHGNSYTLMQKLQHRLSELTYRYGDLIGAASGLSPILIGLGGSVKVLTVAKTALASVTAKLGITMGALAGKAALAVVAIAALTAANYYLHKATEAAMDKTTDFFVELAGGRKPLEEHAEKIEAVSESLREQGKTEEEIIAIHTERLTAMGYEIEEIERFLGVHGDMIESYENAEQAIANNTIALLEAGHSMDDAVEMAMAMADGYESILDGVTDVDEAIRILTEANTQAGMSSEEAALAAEIQAEAMGIVSQSMEEAAQAADNLYDSMNDLISSVFELAGIQRDVEKQTWRYEDALEKLAEVQRDSESTERDLREAIHGTEETRENLIATIWGEYEADKTTMKRKKELEGQYMDLAQAALESSHITQQEYRDLVTAFYAFAADVESSVKDTVNPAHESVKESSREMADNVQKDMYDTVIPAHEQLGRTSEEVARGIEDDVENTIAPAYILAGDSYEDMAKDIARYTDEEIEPSFRKMEDVFDDTAKGIAHKIDTIIIPCLDKMKKKMEEVHNTEVKPEITADISGLEGKVSEARRLINSIRGASVSIGASGGALIGAQSGRFIASGGEVPVAIHPPEAIINGKRALNILWNLSQNRMAGGEVYSPNEDNRTVSHKHHHSGTIQLVSKDGEGRVDEVVDIILDEIRREVRS